MSYPTRQQLFVAQDLTIYATLSTPITATDTVFTVSNNSPAILAGMVLYVEGEKLLVSSVSGNSITVNRGYGGTAAVNHPADSPVKNLVTSEYHNRIADEIFTLESSIGATDGIATLASTGKIPLTQLPLASTDGTTAGIVKTGDGWATALATDADGTIHPWTYKIEYYPGANFASGFQALNVFQGGGNCGTFNTAFGYQAGRYIATPSTQNVFVGYLTGATSTAVKQTNCVGVGAFALQGGNNISQCIAIGTNALGGSPGSDNVAIGFQAGQVLTNTNNVLVGTNAGYGSTGGANVCIGYFAGNDLQTGAQNVCIGYQSNCSFSGGNNISIGASARLGNAISGAVQLGAGTNAVSNTFQWKTRKYFDDAGNFYPLVSTPATSAATATSGAFWADANFLYFATAANTIKRVAIASW